MERRVIKFNLVGAICILILIIAGIVGIVMLTINLSKNIGKKPDSTSAQQQPECVEEPNQSNEIKDKIVVNGEEKEITLKKYVNEDNMFEMLYETSRFYVETTTNDKVVFKSAESDTISLEIQKFDQGFKDKSQEIIVNEAKKMRENETYSLEAKDLNGRLCYVEEETKDEDLYITYTIEKEERYYIVNVKIGKDFIESNKQIIQRMMRTFRIM
jgi:hypothetical protein